MTTSIRKPGEFRSLAPAVVHFLLALAGGEKHDYAFMQNVEDNSSGSVKMRPGTLYGSIRRKLAAGQIEECDEQPDPEKDDQRPRRLPRLPWNSPPRRFAGQSAGAILGPDSGPGVTTGPV